MVNEFAKSGAQTIASEVIEIDSDGEEDAGGVSDGRAENSDLISVPVESTMNSSKYAEERAARFENIKKDLEELFNSGLKFEGTFACFERYSANSAPNPFLRIHGLGAIGIPLNAREAIVILSSETNLTTKSSKHTWGLPSTQIHVDNPEWDVWIQEKAGPTVFKVLAGKASVPPTYKFRKLILQEPGSQFTGFEERDSETEKSEDRIGTLIILLPSSFDGAQLLLRHADDSLSVDLSHQSGLSTSVIAAYSGIASELAPISSGYRLSLAYDILQPNTHLGSKRSGLPDVQAISKRLGQILTSWMEGADTESGTLHCLLKGKYERGPSFGRRSLTGSDTYLITHLNPLASELGFHLHFAHVELVITESSSIEEIYHYDGYGENPYDELGQDDFHFNMEDEEGELSVIQVVDAEGMPLIATGVIFSTADLINGSMTEHEPDVSDFEKDDDTTASLTNTYRRTVLLISKRDMKFSPDINHIYDYASLTLRNSHSLTPSDKEMILIDSLLHLSETCSTEQLRTVAHLLTEHADRWNDLPLLLRTLKACRVDQRIDLLGVEALISMYQAFGWDALKDFYSDALKKDETNLARQALIEKLLEMAREEGTTEIIAWCETQQEQLLRSLCAFDVNQIGWLVELAMTRGGEFLRDVIFPQLEAQKLEKTLWIALMRRLQDISTWSPELVGTLTSFCVVQAVEALPAFPTVTNSRVLEPDSESIMEVIQVCVETGNNHLCDTISGRMRGTASAGTFPSRFPPWIFYSRLAVSLDVYLQARDTPDAVRPFFSDAVDSMLSAGSDAKHECSMTPPILNTINMAIRRAGGIFFLKERLQEDYWKARTSADLQALVRSIRAGFAPPPGDTMGASELLNVTSVLVDAAIHAFDLATLIPRKPTLSYSAILPDVLNMFRFCFQVGIPSKCQDLLVKLLEPPAGFTIPQNVDRILVPLIPALKTFLATVHLDYRTDPFKTFCVAVIKAYANTVMGQKPHELVSIAELEGVGCRTCSECAALKTFFLGDESSIDFSRPQAKRSHLEYHLAATTPWGVTWETHKLRSPHTLRITKPPRMTAVNLTLSTQKGMTLLAELGDGATQRLILGADQDWILAKIAPPKQSSTSQKRSAGSTQPMAGQVRKKARTS
ncbi:hypothetical protein C8R44DRAFT_983104 [Mycena epipterygia]|nr:hypothetical protein C8R44DRAFT_983104 [Mycena epipterygia]